MAIPTIEEFIERGKVNCRASAVLTVKQRYAQLMKGEVGDAGELKRRTDEYIRSPEGEAAVEAAMKAGRFYKLLCSENAAAEPRVVSAYEKHIAGMEQDTENAAERRKNKNRRKKANHKKNKQEKRKELFRQYMDFVYSAEDERRIVEIVCALVAEHYSDIRRVLPAKFLKEANSEFVTENIQGKFMRRLYDEAALNKKRIDNVIYMSGPLYRNMNELARGFAARRILDGTDYGESTRNSIIRDFIERGGPACPRLGMFYSAVTARFGREKLTALITSGEGYNDTVEFMREQLKNAENAHKLILKEIPEDVTQLYPGARGMHRHFILHLGPTNSGKTYESLIACRNAQTGVYLAPLRLLAYEICEKFNLEGVPCRMKTGEEEIDVPFATHTSSTVEMLNTTEYYDVAVVDECQLIEDEERGGAWTAAVLGLMSGEIHLCASEDAENILISLIKLCGDSYEIKYHKRSVPLKCDDRDFVFPRDVEPEDALIAFSKKSVLNYAERLRAVGIKASVIYGDLPYDVRRSEVSRFVRGDTEVVVATDAVGMGLNLPIKRVVFLESYKFDGRKRRFLHGNEIKQIAGRAGRMGMYDVGYYNAEEFKEDIRRKMQSKNHSITRARLRIPESIIGVDMPLSEILLRWGTIPDDGIFTKNSVEREVMLARELEKKSSDKLLIYRFVTIPFAETRKELYEFWLELFEREITDTRKPVFYYINTIERRGSELEDHELAYRKCDILYFYYDRFGVKEDLNAIMDLKHDISADIMSILSGEPSGEGTGSSGEI